MRQSPKYYVQGIGTHEFHDPESVGAFLSAEEITIILGEILLIVEREWRLLAQKGVGAATRGDWKSIELMRNGRLECSVTDYAPFFNRFCLASCEKLGFGSAFISVTPPGSRITPHFGLSNAKLRCHLQVTGSGWALIRRQSTARNSLGEFNRV